MHGPHELRVVVSVSDPTFHNSMSTALLALGSDRIRILPPDGDLSLYGNFRRLINASDAEWVTLCADDDFKAPGFVVDTLRYTSEDTIGVCPAISLQEFHRPTASFGRVLQFIAAAPPSRSLVLQLSRVQASWIFGLYRRQWIADAFPDDEWDWIDCAIVQKAILERGFVWCPDADPIVCGWVPQRLPWAVRHGIHSTAGWESYWKRRLLPQKVVHPWIWATLIRSRFRRTAKALNTRVAVPLEAC